MKIKALLLACVLLINPVWASTMEDDEDNKHIVSMEFTKHPELVDIDFIVYFPRLQRLRIEDCPQLQDNYHWVSHLRNLTHLVLSNIKLTTLVPLEGLSNLVSLNVAFKMKFLQYESANAHDVLQKLQELLTWMGLFQSHLSLNEELSSHLFCHA